MEQQYVQMTLNEWIDLKGSLEAELRGAAASFVRIGYLLRKIDETEGYRNDGSGSLGEWAYDNYGLSKSQVSRFISINKEFSVDGYSDQLKLEYARFGSAKLTEMLALPDPDREMVSPEMKREDIRELKRMNQEAAEELKEQQAATAMASADAGSDDAPAAAVEKAASDGADPAAGVEEPPAAVPEETTGGASADAAAAGVEDAPAAGVTEAPGTAQTDEPKEPALLPQHVWIREFFRDHGELMNELYSSKAYTDGNADGMKEIVNPSGAMTYKHGLTIVSFLDARIMVKVFPAAPAPMSWDGFFKIASEIFEGRISGKDTYRNVFGVDPVVEKESEPEKPAKNTAKVPGKKTDKKPSAAVKKEQKDQSALKPAGNPEPAEPESAVAPAQPEEPAPQQEVPETEQEMSIQDNNVPENAEKCSEEAGKCSEETADAQSGQQVEQVEIDGILPEPTDADPLEDLRDRFLDAINSLKIMAEAGHFENMEPTINRLSVLRNKYLYRKSEMEEMDVS